MALEKQLTTADQFEAFLALPENADRRFELVDGEIVEKMPTFTHGKVSAKIVVRLGTFLEQTGLGDIVVETRFKPAADRYNDRIPDVSVVLTGRNPPPDGPVPFMPDVAIEVKSPDDSLKLMRDKAQFYLENGSRMVWLVFPDKKLVEVYTADDQMILVEGDTLTGGDVLPGFELPVSSIFANVQ
jgi:Uma2 family endonuclease